MFDLVPFNRHDFTTKGDYFNHWLDSFFKDDFFAPFQRLSSFSSFKVDLKETDEDYTVEADLPGVKKEDITLEYKNNYLTIRAKRETLNETKAEDKNYVCRERSYGQFQRSFYIDNVAHQDIDAEFKEGILKIKLPKMNKTMIPSQTIPIK